MYIKKVRKKNKGSDTYYEYLHLVDSIRTENGPRQRLILNLGAIDIPFDQYKALANCIEGMLNGQRALLSHDLVIEKYATDAVRQIIAKRSEKVQEVNPEPEYQLVDLNSIEAAEPRSIGAEYVCHNMWKQLKFNNVLLEAGVSPKQLPLFEALVVGRLIGPWQ